jgi:hypothetical protein
LLTGFADAHCSRPVHVIKFSRYIYSSEEVGSFIFFKVEELFYFFFLSITYLMSKFECEYCLKKYTRIHYFKQHYRFCQELHNTKHHRECDAQETNDQPTVKQLYSVIQTLLTKYETLEKEVAYLKEQAKIQNKKVDVPEWLSRNVSIVVEDTNNGPVVRSEHNHLAILTQQIERINTTPDEFQSVCDVLFQASVKAYIEHVITRCFSGDGAKANMDIQCFSNKQIIYIYDASSSSWVELKSQHTTVIIQQLYKHMMIVMKLWKEQHQDTITNNQDMYQNTYIPILNKILTANIAHSSVFSILYNTLKRDASELYYYKKDNRG